MRGDVKKFKVYVKDPNPATLKKLTLDTVVQVPKKTMRICNPNPKQGKVRARHNCATGRKDKSKILVRKW